MASARYSPRVMSRALAMGLVVSPLLTGCDGASRAQDEGRLPGSGEGPVAVVETDEAGFCNTLPQRVAVEQERVSGDTWGWSFRLATGAGVAPDGALVVPAVQGTGSGSPVGAAPRRSEARVEERLVFAMVYGSGSAPEPVARLEGSPRTWGVAGDTLWWVDRELRVSGVALPTGAPLELHLGDAESPPARRLAVLSGGESHNLHRGTQGTWFLDPSSRSGPGFPAWRDGTSLLRVQPGSQAEIRTGGQVGTQPGTPTGSLNLRVDTLLTWHGPGNRLLGAPFSPFGRFPYQSLLPDGSGLMLALWSDDAPDTLRLRSFLGADPEAKEVVVQLPAVALSRERRDEAMAAGLMVLDSAVARDARSPYPPVDPISEVNEAAVLARVHFPMHQPPFRELRAGTDGSAWLRCDDAPDPAPYLAWDAPSRRWAVIDPEGRPLFQVMLPEGSRLVVASSDQAWGATVANAGEDAEASQPTGPTGPMAPANVLVRWHFLSLDALEDPSS